jgi:hypothetical protein
MGAKEWRKKITRAKNEKTKTVPKINEIFFNRLIGWIEACQRANWEAWTKG